MGWKVNTISKQPHNIKPKIGNEIKNYDLTYFFLRSCVNALNIATVMVGPSIVLAREMVLLVGEGVSKDRPFICGVDGTLRSSLVFEVIEAERRGRLASGLVKMCQISGMGC